MKVSWISAAALQLPVVLAVFSVTPASAQLDREPEIVQFEQTSAVRVDRTRYDYTYMLHIKGTGQNIRNAEFVVTSNVPYTQVLDGSSKVSAIDAGRLTRSSDVIVLRHDRTYPFSFKNLRIRFTGQALSEQQSGQIAIGAVDLLGIGGRAGHEGFFELRATSPVPGQSLQLRVLIKGGATSAKYSLVNNLGSVIASGELLNPWSGHNYFVGMIAVPAVPFSIKIDASDNQGRTGTFQSSPYQPSASGVQVRVRNGAFRYGQHITGVIRVFGPGGSTQSIKLHVPESFTAAQTNWSMSLPPSGALEIPFDIATPGSGEPRFFDLLVVSGGATESVRVFAR